MGPPTGHDLSRVPPHATTTAPAGVAGVQPRRWRTMVEREGRALSEGVRRRYEALYRQSLCDVRIHTGPIARSISTSLEANGVTDGRNIALRRPEFANASTAFPGVLAHELAHVRQQRGRAGRVLHRVPWSVDGGRYYTDRGGAVVRGRELQQTYMSIDVFQRPDGNWQVRHRNPVPHPDSFPAVDPGLFYADQAAAERRASHLRAYGFVVEVFQRSDSRWQCRLIRQQGPTPGLPTSIGSDAGLYYTAEASATRRAEALQAAGFEASVVERSDGNFQANVLQLPTFPDPPTAAASGAESAEPAVTPDAATPEPTSPAAVAEAEGEADELDVHARAARFVDDLNGALATLRAARLEALQGEASGDDASIELPTIDVAIAPREERSPQQQAHNIIEGRSWTCRSAHLGDNARHVRLRIGGEITFQPQANIEEHFGEGFYNDFVDAWGQAMQDNDLRNYAGQEGWAPADAYHLEMPVRDVPQTAINACIAEYFRLTRDEGEDQVPAIESLYEEEIQALSDAD